MSAKNSPWFCALERERVDDLVADWGSAMVAFALHISILPKVRVRTPLQAGKNYKS